MTTKHFYGKHEHSTTYAAASFLMPGAAARVEAIRAKKRKLKHASPPIPPPSAPEAPPVLEPVIAPSETPASEPAAHTEQQAKSPVVDVSLPANSGEAHESEVDVAETEAMDTSTSPVVKEVLDLAEQHEAGATVAPVELAHKHPDEPAESPEHGSGTVESPIAPATETPQIEQPKQADEPAQVQESKPLEHHEETSQKEVETLDSPSVDSNPEPTQDDEVPEVDHSIDDKQDSGSISTPPESAGAKEVNNRQNESQTPPPTEGLHSENTSPIELSVVGTEPTTDNRSATEEPASAEEAIHNDQTETQTSSPAQDLPTENATPVKPPMENSATVPDNTPAPESANPVPLPPSSTPEKKTEPPLPSTPALTTDTNAHTNGKNPDQISTVALSPSPSSPSSPSRHTRIKTSEVNWVKRPEFD